MKRISESGPHIPDSVVQNATMVLTRLKGEALKIKGRREGQDTIEIELLADSSRYLKRDVAEEIRTVREKIRSIGKFGGVSDEFFVDLEKYLNTETTSFR